MPSKRKSAARSPPGRTRKSTGGKQVLQNDVPEVYQAMLAEASTSNSDHIHDRTPKRRKITKPPAVEDEIDNEPFAAENAQDSDVGEPSKPPQIIYDDFEGLDESDVEFEDVEIGPNLDVNSDDDKPGEPLQLDLSRPAITTHHRTVPRRKPVNSAERKLRLDVHKAHLLLLLLALYNRNRWCESPAVQAILKPLVPRKTIAMLHVDEDEPQYQRVHSFNKGIEEICAIWRKQWEVTARGMRRAYWREDVDAVKESEDAEDFIDFDDFTDAARTRVGSRDLGAQLFCALLRSIAVETRLVCSLQVLPFSGVAKGQTPEKTRPDYIHAPPSDFNTSTWTPRRKPKRITESSYAVFWVEVLSPATATWIPLDPLVRNTINKPKTGFEPPASDVLNTMTYIIAFEDDNSSRDVTRRYAQWYNAKTRRTRVEATRGGEAWWAKAMGVFAKKFREVRDEIEDAEFIRRAEAEGMPRNVQDFRGHPVFVLERHLRANEVIEPRREVGKVVAGVSKTGKLESVFRRRDVHLCRTADAWYRRGRDVRVGEAPLKRVVAKRGVEYRSGSADGEDEGEAEGTGLYAEYQTDVYEPPPVVDGRIPKNAYGNLDIYVPSMIPAGAIHVRHPLAVRAAKVLETDFVEAVTGFEFKGRQGTAVINGVVVSKEMRVAMVAVLVGLQSQTAEESEAERTRILLGMWRRWLTALRVREKVEREYGANEAEDEEVSDSEIKPSSEDEDSDEAYQEDNDDAGGGFTPEALEAPPDTTNDADANQDFPNLKPLPSLLPSEVVHHEIIIIDSPHKPPPPPQTPNHVPHQPLIEADEPGGFFADDDLFDDNTHLPALGNHAENVEERGGGLTVDDEGESGGGFLPNDNDEQDDLPQPHHKTHIPIPIPIDDSGGRGGGGFLPDDGRDIDAPPHSHDTSNFIASAEREDGGGGLRLLPAPTSPSQARAAPTSPPEASDGGGDGDGNGDSGRGGFTSHETYPPDDAHAPAPADTDDAPPAMTQESDSSVSDTSMLSHDPAESDADPEWLVESLGMDE